MKKRIVLIGLGNHGRSWASDVLSQCSEFVDFAGVVEQNEEIYKNMELSVPWFRSVEEAVRVLNPVLQPTGLGTGNSLVNLDVFV